VELSPECIDRLNASRPSERRITFRIVRFWWSVSAWCETRREVTRDISPIVEGKVSAFVQRETAFMDTPQGATSARRWPEQRQHSLK
jgi:hypothetical protein